MPRLLAADAQRSDDPDLSAPEAPVPAAASPSPIETAPNMQCVTGTFADPLHESAFAAQLFRMAYPAHVLLMAAILADLCWNALVLPEERSYFVALVLLCALPALVGRVLLHRTGSRDPVRSQRLGCWVWAVVLVLACAVDAASYITAPTPYCAAWTEPTPYLLPFEVLLTALVNGSHGLGFTCKFALVALVLTECIASMISCHDPELDPWFICSIGVVVLGAATTHTAELYLRRSYAEKVRADAETMHGRAEEARERRQLEERMEQLQAEKERLLYDMQRRGRPLDDDDDRSAICRGLQAGRSQPYPPSLGDTGPDAGPDADPSEAGGPAPSDSLPTLPPGPPSSASSGSVVKKQLVAEALADMATNAVAPQQSVHMAAHQPDSRASPSSSMLTEELDEAKAIITAMETTNAVGSDAPILKPSSAGSVNYGYVAAALAIRRGLFLKQNGSVNYSSAARHYVADTGRAHGGQVKEWVRKLELLDQAKGQATLENTHR